MNTSKLRALLLVTTITFFSACKKDTCWQGYENGTNVPGMVICDKSLSELQNMYPNTWFYNAAEPTYCWKVTTGGSSLGYARNTPESIARKIETIYNCTYTKIDCNSFCRWIIHERHKSKITGFYNTTRLVQETYTTDTCSKLFVGKVVVYRETADSLITREYNETY